MKTNWIPKVGIKSGLQIKSKCINIDKTFTLKNLEKFPIFFRMNIKYIFF